MLNPEEMKQRGSLMVQIEIEKSPLLLMTQVTQTETSLDYTPTHTRSSQKEKSSIIQNSENRDTWKVPKEK